MTERDMEDAIAADPTRYLGELGLDLVARQYSIGSYRFDLLFADRHGGKLIVEIQKGTLDRAHAYKILDYYYEYRDANPDDFIDVMIVANQITVERKKRLQDFGISFCEIPESMFLAEPVAEKPSATDSPTIETTSDGSRSEPDRAEAAPSLNYHFQSLGPSAFIDAVRSAIASKADLRSWKVGGRSSLTAAFMPLKQLLDLRFGRGLTPQLWMERPQGGRASCKFEIAYAIPSLEVEVNLKLRESIATAIRSELKGLRLPDGVALAGGSTIIKCVVSCSAVKDVRDDTADAIAMYESQVEKIVEFVRFLDVALSNWTMSPLGLPESLRSQR